MGSRLRKRKKNDPPDKWRSMEEDEETLEYEKAKLNNIWEIERGFADDIMKAMKRNGIDDIFKLDKLTKGKGNCFMIATIQQIRREEVLGASRAEVRNIAASMNHSLLRQGVYNWIMEHLTHPKIIKMKEVYELDQAVRKDLGEETKSWDAYWLNMLQDGIWADNWFVQATALFLRMDFWIMDTTCTEKRPYFQVDGNLEENVLNTETLYLGLAHESHYQSLLLVDDKEVNEKEEEMIDKKRFKEEKDMMDEEQNKDKEDSEESSKELCKEEETSQNEEIWDEDEDDTPDKDCEDNKCPVCKKVLKNVLLHIKKAKNCKSEIGYNKLQELESKSKIIRKEKTKLNYKNWVEKLNKPGQLQQINNTKKATSRERQRNDNYEKLMDREKEYKAQSRKRKRIENEDKVKEYERVGKANYRKRIGSSSKSRLNRFKEDIMYGPLFICICCHQKMFRHSVVEATEQMMRNIDQKIPLTNVIVDMNVVTRVITEYPLNPWSAASKKKKEAIGIKYICTYCVGYLKLGKMPPICVMNSLHLQDTDAQLKA